MANRSRELHARLEAAGGVLAAGPVPMVSEGLAGVPTTQPAVLAPFGTGLGIGVDRENRPGDVAAGPPPPGRGLLHLVLDARGSGMAPSDGATLTTQLQSPSTSRVVGSGVAAEPIGPLLMATNYDHAMAFPRTVDAPWGNDDADDQAPVEAAGKTSYAYDIEEELLNHDPVTSPSTKVRRRLRRCGGRRRRPCLHAANAATQSVQMRRSDAGNR